MPCVCLTCLSRAVPCVRAQNLIFRFLQNVRCPPVHALTPELLAALHRLCELRLTTPARMRAAENACADLALREHGSADRGADHCARRTAPNLTPTLAAAAAVATAVASVRVRWTSRPARRPAPDGPPSLAWQGFDEYMNLVLDEAEELSLKKKTKKALGTARARQTSNWRCACAHAHFLTATRRLAHAQAGYC